MKNPKINIVTIPVVNLNQTTRFYREVFALSDHEISEGDDHVAFFLAGEMSLVLYDFSEFMKMMGEDEYELKAPRMIFTHNAKDSMEVDSILQSVSKAGGTITQEGISDEWGYTGLFKDTEGYMWEVTSWSENEQI